LLSETVAFSKLSVKLEDVFHKSAVRMAIHKDAAGTEDIGNMTDLRNCKHGFETKLNWIEEKITAKESELGKVIAAVNPENIGSEFKKYKKEDIAGFLLKNPKLGEKFGGPHV